MAPDPAPGGAASTRAGDVRARNERIALAARRHHFDRDSRVPFLCECSDQHCEELVRLTLGEYRRAREAGDFLVLPGHQVADARIVRIRELCWLYRGDAGEAART